MKELIAKLSEPLTKDDVELRIGTTSAKGFSLLLYKTARTDIKKLNESGAIWKNKHEYDSLDLLTCTISIYDAEHTLWIDRVDVGTESKTEKQKGLYSDSFKRAGFRWGIGLELYNAPFIWINWEMQERNGKKTPKNFYQSNLSISDYEIKDGHFAKLTIKYDNSVVFTMDKASKKATPKPKTEPKIKSSDVDIITDLVFDTETDVVTFLGYYKVKAISDLSQANATDAIKKLQKKKG